MNASSAGEAPDDALQPAHRDAEQRRAIGVLGAGPQRDADRAVAEEAASAMSTSGTTISTSTSLPLNVPCADVKSALKNGR